METPVGLLPKKTMLNVIGSLVRPAVSLGVSGKSDRGMIFLILGMFAAGLFAMAWGGYEIVGSHATGNWPGTEGTITASSVRKEIRRESGKTYKSYSPNVRYRYQINGRPYTGHRIVFGSETKGLKFFAQRIVDRYPSGKNITVYYNPDDLQYAILEKGLTWSSIAILLIGVVFFAAGVLCVKSKLKERRKAQIL